MFKCKPSMLFKASILAICVLSIVYLSLFTLNEGWKNEFRTYGDIEQSLCEDSIGRGKNWRINRCPQDGIVTVFQGGRFGNQMWEYASVWAVARSTGLAPYVPRCIILELGQVFEHLTIPTFEGIEHCPVKSTTFVRSIEEWSSTNQNIILQRFVRRPGLVLTWVQDIVKEFTFTKELRDNAHQILRRFVETLPRNKYTFVGVHVRRTDYVRYLQIKYNETVVNPQFFSNAMAYFRRKYTNCLFVFVSDDPGWCHDHFGRLEDVVIASGKANNTPATDMAIMASCNHTIIDYGTFGEWGSILAGGETVYKNITLNVRIGAGRFMKNWIMLD